MATVGLNESQSFKNLDFSVEFLCFLFNPLVDKTREKIVTARFCVNTVFTDHSIEKGRPQV